jgi:hypothetical protein
MDSSKFTVIIPHSNTDPTRDRNLKYIIHYYRKHLPNSIIIVPEQNSDTDLNGFPIDLHLKIAQDKSFHKTKLFNEAFKKSDTPFLVLADNDCIVHPEVLNRLEEEMEDCDFLLPFDFVHNWTPQETHEFITKGIMLPGRSRVHRNTGGCNVVRRETYIDVKGFDEHIRGWGCEDSIFPEKIERFHRMKRWTKHNMYHLYHNVVHAKGRNPEFNYNNREWIKIKNYNKEQMREYINTIPMSNMQ